MNWQLSAHAASASSVPAASALDPAGPVAEKIAEIWWWMFGVFTGVFVIVMFLLFLAVALRNKGEKTRVPLGETRFIAWGGIIIPALILIAFLIYNFSLTSSLRIPEGTLPIRLTGHMFWWDVRYPELNITTANEIHIPVGRPVRLELDSKDVIHSIWVPSLSGKTDLLPGIPNVHWLRADKPGIYLGECAEFCGVQHARMALRVVALPPEEFDAWIAERQRPVLIPDSPRLRLGYETFQTAGCAECHAIKGTPFSANAGPDLTHLGSRLTLGAGTIPNNFGNLAGWISNPQNIKPGNKMPASYLEPEKLHALTEFLMSLK